MRTTIEERAQEYAHQYRRDAHDLKGERADAAFAAYCQGAEDEHKELTRWHDPKEELPTDSRWVLVHTQDELQPYCTGRYFEETQDTKAYWFIRGNSDWTFDYVIGWREIHE